MTADNIETAGARRSHRSWYTVLAIVVLNTVVLLALVEAGSAGTLGLLDARQRRRRGPDGPLPVQRLTYYSTKPWGDAFWREHREAERRQAYEPYVVWRPVPYAGTHVTVAPEKLRLTPASACTESSYRVFVFGGSTAWGFGSPDWGTIPAYIQAEMVKRGAKVCVVNYAQIAYVSTQEVIELLRRLQAGHKPNLVLFFNGYNDALSTFDSRRPGVHFKMDWISEKFERDLESPGAALELLVRQSYTLRLLRRAIPPRSPDLGISKEEVESLSEDVISVYLANYRAAEALAAANGFAFEFFWQPSLYTGTKPLSWEEKRMRPDSRRSIPLMRTVYRKLEAAAPGYGHLTYLGNAFDAEPSPMFIDYVHLTPEGSQVMANRILDVVCQRSESPARAGCGPGL